MHLHKSCIPPKLKALLVAFGVAFYEQKKAFPTFQYVSAPFPLCRGEMSIKKPFLLLERVCIAERRGRDSNPRYGN